MPCARGRWMLRSSNLILMGFVFLAFGQRVFADPVCLVSRGATLYRFNADGNGSVEEFPNQPGAIIGMTTVPAGVTVAGCVAGDVLAVQAVNEGKFWRVDGAACGTPTLVEVGQRAPGLAIVSLDFAYGQLWAIGDDGGIKRLDHDFEIVGEAVNVSTGSSNIGGLAFDGVHEWFAIDGITDTLYRFADPPSLSSWTPVGNVGFDMEANGLEMYNDELWGAFRVPGSPSTMYVGTFDLQTGAFSLVWEKSPAGGNVGFVTLPAPSGVRGDVNCDGLVDGLDAAAFVTALVNPGGFAAQYPDCGILGADLSGDCQVNGDDIQAFVNELIG